MGPIFKEGDHVMLKGQPRVDRKGGKKRFLYYGLTSSKKYLTILHTTEREDSTSIEEDTEMASVVDNDEEKNEDEEKEDEYNEGGNVKDQVDLVNVWKTVRL